MTGQTVYHYAQEGTNMKIDYYEIYQTELIKIKNKIKILMGHCWNQRSYIYNDLCWNHAEVECMQGDTGSAVTTTRRNFWRAACFQMYYVRKHDLSLSSLSLNRLLTFPPPLSPYRKCHAIYTAYSRCLMIICYWCFWSSFLNIYIASKNNANQTYSYSKRTKFWMPQSMILWNDFTGDLVLGVARP